ncbi:toxin (filamentation induced by cAMP protein, mobile mystery protein B) of toxin-antitoxin module, Fic superfamily [Psychroflexus torquis ATCC 700755]|uniref:Toxin (Filamentation induced by cAMP protein, mobile mystery protein B) of toxin-antitoxin module, Fic superfamily n=1 Tax=Psychroflexus torquis (strain ATCC 700755 / CIP 106069 / ACAM 623) TaxID=313595 RepID=K4IXF7_PSYTT|nr:type II toxin-antitoxin system death-on-curing family toxin [Psychroflexus torquis]AFU70145.1 toxin (filamentation induced by cAMP protein, mobile mystery protein B) of toxin-antitoxin module, Fic superfamily [Psychroflexus torquis ATCC 700755]
METYIYFDIQHAIRTHDFIIENSGGNSGIIEIGKIESVLEHIQNDLYYPEFEEKLTHLVFAVNKFHAFNDGNKRTSIALGAYLLEVNGIEYCIDKFIIEMENIAVYVADNKIDKELLQEIISSIVIEDDFNEELKLKIIDALSE